MAQRNASLNYNNGYAFHTKYLSTYSKGSRT